MSLCRTNSQRQRAESLMNEEQTYEDLSRVSDHVLQAASGEQLLPTLSSSLDARAFFKSSSESSGGWERCLTSVYCTLRRKKTPRKAQRD